VNGAARNPADIRQRVEALGEWFQNLDLHGVATAPQHYLGDYPANKWRHIAAALPSRLDGMSVLDIGCNAGFHALECKRRGARRVLGIDADERYLAQARLAAEVLDLEVDFERCSVYALDRMRERFDYVFLLGVIYHLRYPLYALDLAARLTRRRMVFQTMLRGSDADERPAADYDFWDHRPFARPGFPKLHFIEASYAGDATNWWIPNRAAAEAMLRSAGLRPVAHPEAETWICEPTERAGYVWERELAATL
jgi:tRNA (mo5U34)-methyltransferase